MKGSPLLVQRKIARTIELQESISKDVRIFCLHVHLMQALCPQRSEDGIGSSGAGIVDSWESSGFKADTKLLLSLSILLSSVTICVYTGHSLQNTLSIAAFQVV
ncbi:hypothetical protein STEG23_017206 [Scotinomys teguina]